MRFRSLLAVFFAAILCSLAWQAEGYQATDLAHAQLPKVIEKGPRVNVQHSDFAGGADPFFVADSTPAFNAAIAYIVSGANATQAQTLYVPAGHYKISSTLRIPSWLNIVGDSASSTVLQNTNATQNLITVSQLIAEPAGMVNANESSGSLRDLTLAGSGASTTGTLLENAGAVGYITVSLRLINNGGRGYVRLSSAERGRDYNLEIDNVRWPLVNTHNANENHVFGLEINNPGADQNGYCYGTNCANGVGPNAFAGNQTITSASGNGTSIVFTVASASGSPVITVPGGKIVITGTGAYDGTYNSTAVTAPSGGVYTVTVASTKTGTATLSPSSLLQAGIVPNQNYAVWNEAVNTLYSGWTIKATEYAGCFQAIGAEDQKVQNGYCEGFSGSSVTAGIAVGGYMPWTSLSAAMGTASSGTTPVVNASWMPNITGSASTEASVMQSETYCIGPADGVAGSTATSTAFPSVTKGTRECLNGWWDTGNVFHYTNRGTTAYAWPSGSRIEFSPLPGYGSGLTIDNVHMEGNIPGNPSLAPICDDVTYICAEVLHGVYPDNFLYSQVSNASVPPQATYIRNSSVYMGSSELFGQGYIKAVGGGAIVVEDVPLNEQAEVSSNVNMETVVVGTIPFKDVIFPGGYDPSPTYRSSGNKWLSWDLFTKPYVQFYQATSSSSILGQGIGFQFANQGWVFNTNLCNWDMASYNPSSGTNTDPNPHVRNRWCYYGGSGNNGGGFRMDMWNYTSSLYQPVFDLNESAAVFSKPLQPTGGIQSAFVTLTASGTLSFGQRQVLVGMASTGQTLKLPDCSATVAGQDFWIDSENSTPWLLATVSGQSIFGGSNSSFSAVPFTSQGGVHVMCENGGYRMYSNFPRIGSATIGSFGAGGGGSVSGTITASSYSGSGSFTVTTTASGTPSSSLAVISFTAAALNMPNVCVLAPQNDAARTVGANVSAGVPTASSFTVQVGPTVLGAGVYQYGYVCN